MKAHINGITVEGTPQEIMEYQRLTDEKTKVEKKPFAPNIFPKITCGFTAKMDDCGINAGNNTIGKPAAQLFIDGVFPNINYE